MTINPGLARQQFRRTHILLYIKLTDYVSSLKKIAWISGSIFTSRSFLSEEVRSIVSSLLWWQKMEKFAKETLQMLATRIINLRFWALRQFLSLLSLDTLLVTFLICKRRENHACCLPNLSYKGSRGLGQAKALEGHQFCNLNERLTERQHSSIIQTVFIISLTAFLGNYNFNILYIY